MLVMISVPISHILPAYYGFTPIQFLILKVESASRCFQEKAPVGFISGHCENFADLRLQLYCRLQHASVTRTHHQPHPAFLPQCWDSGPCRMFCKDEKMFTMEPGDNNQ